MLKIRRDADISDVDGDWFRARWHYSFDSYRDPEYTCLLYTSDAADEL